MHRYDEWKRIRDRIPSVDCVPVSLPPFDEKLMREGAPRILAQVNDDRTIGEICKITNSSEFHVGRILVRQIEAGRLKIVKPRGVAPAIEKPPEGLTAEALLAAGRSAAERGELDGALRFLRAAKALDPENRKTTTEVEKLEQGVRAKVEVAGIVPASVPILARTLEELTKLQISPQEGFLLTRFNGSYDLQSIVKLSSMPQLDVHVVVWKLLQAGHIRLEKR
jgi:hypothetical protein